MKHDPLCRLLKDESCSGVGGSDWGHYTDSKVCRNCRAHCDCDRVREIREHIASDIEASRSSRAAFDYDDSGYYRHEADTYAREDAARIARGTL